MIPINAKGLIELRAKGSKPAKTVWINVGDLRPVRGELGIDRSMTPDLLDLRCIVGLDVTFFADCWDDFTAAVYAKAQEQAREICVMSTAFGDDIGWWWIKRWPHNDGKIDFSDRHWHTQFEDAQADCSLFAHRNNKAAYAAANARELDALHRLGVR